ncbi:MAG: S9 family peptidase, partial [Planctomycetes bacterium]|nr:S9 family peptidase [Planctomycetota bacterium]
VSATLDQEVGNYAVADQRAGLVNVTVRWPDGRGPIYFLITEQGATHLYTADECGDCRLQVGGQNIVFAYSADSAGTIAYGLSNPANPGELYVRTSGQAGRLTDLNPWLAHRRLSPPHGYWYPGLEGTPVHAWEIRPLGFEADKRYPTVVQVHCSMFCWDFSLEFQCLAAAGYIVAYFNQRGTTAGYGQAWTKAGAGAKNAWGYDEVMLGVDDLVTRDYVDSTRMGVTGGSCGGYLTNWIVGHTNRFKAAVTQRSISDHVSNFGTADIGPESGEVKTGGLRPWTDINTYWQMSPLSAAEHIHTPLLILHADEDHRCPFGQAEELFAALRWMGREVEMVVFQGESHGLTRGGRPGNRIEHVRRSLDWFEKYLGRRPA